MKSHSHTGAPDKYTGTLNILVIIFLVFLPFSGAYAQQERRDSLKAATIYADRNKEEAGSRVVRPVDFKYLPSVTGGADAIKYVQTLPGVSTGAEGSSAIYVRGGNLGGNLITLDGVPVYGSSHLLGLSSVYSSDIVSNVLFQIGGYTSDEGNYTSSHICVTSLDGDMKDSRVSVSASNFLLGASASVPIVKNRLSLIASARLSPIGPELKAVKGLSNAMDSIGNINATVYDLYGKLKWHISDRHKASLSVFNSLDSYGYRYGVTSDDRMRWNNLIVNGVYDFTINSHSQLHSSLSYNSFSSYQGMRKLLDETSTCATIQNPLREWILQSTYSNTVKDGVTLRGGLKARSGKFAPGTSVAHTGGLGRPVSLGKINDAVSTWLLMAHMQAEFSKPEKYQFRIAGRLNYFSSHRPLRDADDCSYINPEASLLARVNILKSFGLEATVDWTTQYYHTLEGIPMGWSLDLIVPTDASSKPEHAVQYYAGAFLSLKSHRLTVGGYYKDMRNLIYYADASQLFNSAVASWRHNILLGSGLSYGMEVLYEVAADRFNGRLAYTLSKADRLFEGFNDDKRFPAKFDRRHIFNANAEYTFLEEEHKEIGLSAFFTYQTGHRVNLPAWEYTAEFLPDGEIKVPVNYYLEENAFRLQPYIRCDLSCFMRFGIGTDHPMTLNVGIYNVLNRHNVYSVTYDTTERKWKQISLFPIMPSFSWTMEF